jgi:hypothetical protein
MVRVFVGLLYRVSAPFDNECYISVYGNCFAETKDTIAMGKAHRYKFKYILFRHPWQDVTKY